jgi:F-type H+-transporting ATPase subunit b
MLTNRMRGVACAAALFFAAPGLALAQDPHEGHDHAPGEAHGDHAHAPGDHAHGPGDHAHGEAAHGEGAHGDAHGEGHHIPSFDEINWFHGFLGESAEQPPSLLYRKPGTPVPFGALLLNAAILYYLLFRFAKKPVADALENRKTSVMRGMDEAARMKRDAEKRLAEYEAKLERIDEEVERVRREMREAGELERTRILAEARARRERMERDARLLIDQELKAARELLIAETVDAAIGSAKTALTSQVTLGDQQRLSDEYLAGLKQAAVSIRGRA